MNPSQLALARRAGVSQSTISLALRNHPSIPLETRTRLQKMAEKAGYRPNAALAALMAQKQKSLSARSSLAFFYGIDTNPFHDRGALKEFADGVAARCRELGYDLDVFPLADPEISPKRQASILRARGIKGAVIFWNRRDAIDVKYAPLYENFACAVIGTRPAAPLLHIAMPDHYKIGHVAFQHALLEGWKRPSALILPEHDILTDYRVSLGCIAAQRVLNLPNPVPPLVERHDSPKVGSWLERYRPDFVLYSQGETGLDSHLPRWRDVQLYYWDVCGGLRGMMLGIDNSLKRVGAAGVNLVVAQIHRNERGVPLVQECVLFEGRHSALAA